MKYFTAGLLFALASSVFASNPISTGNPACDAALNGYHAAADVIIATSEKPAGYTLTEDDVALFYQAVEYRNACHEVVLATCGCGNGFMCPPASTTALARCNAGWLQTETLQGSNQTIQIVKYRSEHIQSGVHYVEFNIPIDVFNVDRTTMTIETKENADAPIIPTFNAAGDVMFIRAGSFDLGGKYKCKPTYYDSIEQANINVADVWDQRSTNGAKKGDVVQLGEFANCEAFANQAFIITVKQIPEDHLN